MENKPLAYRLMSVSTEKFMYTMPSKEFDIKKNVVVSYYVDPQLMFNVKEEHIIINCKIKCSILETQELIMEIETLYVFIVDNLGKYVVTKDTKTEFIDKKNLAFLASLIGLSYSTSRGIVLEKCRGTIVETQVMPVINPMKFIKPIEEVKEAKPAKKKK